MKKRTRISLWPISVLCLVSVLISSSGAWAAGLGPHVGYSYVSSENTTIQHGYVGFTYDSAPFRTDTIFNYRCDLGLDIAKWKADDIGYSYNYFYFPDIEMEDQTFWGLNHKSTFGLAIVRTENVRFWIGPSLRFYMLFNSDAWASQYSFDPYNTGNDDSGMLLAGGGGVETGVNIRISDGFGLSFSGGYNYLYHYYMDAGESLENIFGTHGSEHMFFVSVTPLFLLGGDRGN